MRQGAFVMSQVQSIREAFAEASSFLAASGAHEPQRSAQLLLEHVLGVSGAGFYLALAEPFPPERAEAWQAAVSRRGRGEPAQYIIGEQEFYGRPFEVTPDVLIPRPETELLVEAVLRYAAELWPAGSAGAGSGSAGPDRQTAEDGRGDSGGEGGQGGAGTVGGEGSYGGAGTEDGPSEPLPAPSAVRPLTALDIGAGSGAIAVTLAAESPAWRVLAGDLSPAALAVAARNASRHGAAVELRLGDLLEPFRGLETDILVSNPPYIPGGDLAGLQAEVRDFEPHLALDGGADGLDPYRRMLEQLPLLARPPRLIGFELGLGQAEAVAGLLRAAGHWNEVVTIDDLAGIPRHVLGMARG
ncbi:N5-glutamine methyltransferase family protein [Paenibacillus glufosinatiresistens]|uniref:N5-glutamine methyltransferase family protein n=1 Tax=Paenibacillus glufosinatiresistens TaxID=3070657 RepID=UPI00286D8043|nr:HemK/PrmC family methyltransferase [Paenibacillus sp. YX.27]